MTNEEILLKLSEAVAEGEEDAASEFVQMALDAGIDPLVALNDGAAKGMNTVSKLYDEGEAFLPELILSGDAMSAAVNVIFSNMSAEEAASNKAGIVVLGQAKGDVHDIGKNVVGALLAVNGFEVHDLGTDVDVKTFFTKAQEVNADIVGMSTLLTTSLPYMSDTLNYISDTGNREKYNFIVGGGPCTVEFAEKIGADGWSRSASDCVELCRQLMQKNKPGSGEFTSVDCERR